MSLLSISIVGMKQFEKKMKQTVKDAEAATLLRVKLAVLEVHSNVIKLLQKQSSGGLQTRYRGTGKARVVTVSKPGDAPNTDSGRLISSYGFNIFKSTLSGEVGSDLGYSVDLEFGAKKNNMKARPHLGPAFKKYLNDSKGFKFKLTGK